MSIMKFSDYVFSLRIQWIIRYIWNCNWMI